MSEIVNWLRKEADKRPRTPEATRLRLAADEIESHRRVIDAMGAQIKWIRRQEAFRAEMSDERAKGDAGSN